MPAAGQTRAYVALTLVVALWGSYPAFAKIALVHISPFVLVAVRSVLASAFLTVLLFRRGFDQFRALTWADVGQFAFLGFSGLFVSTGGTIRHRAHHRVERDPAADGHAGDGRARRPRYLGERLTRMQWLGVGCSTLGVLLVITRGSWRAVAHLDLLPGDLFILVAQLGWTAYTVYGKQVLADHDAAVATTAAYALGSLMLLPLPFITAPLFPRPDLTSAAAWAVVIYQAFLGAIATSGGTAR